MSSGYILGLSYNYHDAAAVLLQDGSIVAASTEERHTRRKHDPDYPSEAIAMCLNQAGISSRELDWVAYYEQPLVKFSRLMNMSLRSWRRGGRAFLRSTTQAWSAKNKFEIREQIVSKLGVAADRIRLCEHHSSHAASAFFCSPFDTATIVTLDGVGEWETSTIAIGKSNSIKKISAVHFPSSLGLFYSAFTAFLGFEVNEGEYKVMGLAGFGQPKFTDQMLSWFRLDKDGTFHVNHRLLDVAEDGDLRLPQTIEDQFGPRREPEGSFQGHYADVAASLQATTEIVIEHVVRQALRRTAVPALCMAGGVALNSAANQRLRREFGVPMFVQPAAGDAGGALGAAKWVYHCEFNGERRESLASAALGIAPTDNEIAAEIQKNYDVSEWTRYPDDEALCTAVADLLAAGMVVGWVQGRAEWGPRALGQRSILANPCLPEMQAIVNEKIKFREPFRPFAPAVLAPYAKDFFELVEIDGEDERTNPYNFMLAVCRVRRESAERIPAVVHVDGTARVQTVRHETNPLFYNLIERFARRSGVPVVLNTSFNLRGEPIVNTPRDAIKTFEWSGMDALAIGNFLVRK